MISRLIRKVSSTPTPIDDVLLVFVLSFTIAFSTLGFPIAYCYLARM